jgi:hypothetical protein
MEIDLEIRGPQVLLEVPASCTECPLHATVSQQKFDAKVLIIHGFWNGRRLANTSGKGTTHNMQSSEQCLWQRIRVGRNRSKTRRARSGRERFPWKTISSGSAAFLAVMLLGGVFLPTAISNVATSHPQTPKGTKANAGKEKLYTYKNAEWGISFQYPDNYVLRESNESVERNPSWRFGRTIDRHPGEVFVASVEIPTELYPGTDLTAAIFGVSANRNLTKEECWAVAAPGNDSPVDTITLDEIEFHWSEGGDAVSAAGFHDYAGFSNSTCYEIETVVKTMRSGPPEGVMHVDEDELARRMDTLLNSLKLHAATGAANLPTIHSFTAEQLAQQFSPNIYRLRWEVTGASEKQVTIDLNCFTDLSLIEISGVGKRGDAFPCGELKEVSSLAGTLDLKIDNHTGVVLYPEVRLLALGREPVTKTVKISLPVQPVIRGQGQNGQPLGRAAIGQVYSVYPGIKLELVGAAFSDHETIWIGSTSLSAGSSDGRRLEFAVPTSLAAGTVPLYVEDERGKSNQVMVRIISRPPRVSLVNRVYTPEPQEPPLVPGRRVRIIGTGFTSNNTVWIGTVSAVAESDDRYPQFGVYFSVPASLQPGKYSLYITNELGKSNVVTVTVEAAR